MALVEELGKQVAALLEKGNKRYRILRALAGLLVVVFSLVLGWIVSASLPQNGVVVGQAAQSLIGVDGFLAAASGVIAFFYSGKLFDFVSPSSSLMLAMRPIAGAEFVSTAQKEFEKSMKTLAERFKLPRTLNPEEIAEGRKAVLDGIAIMGKLLFEKTGKLVRDLTYPARRMAYYAAFVLVVLVVSAFFSTLAILSGSAQYLGTAFGFTVLGSGFLALAWSDAHVNLARFLTVVQAHESMRSLPAQSPVQSQTL